MPFTNKAFVPVGEPKRGDVFVFNYPNNPKENYIKRVIGVGGDTVTYRNKLLTINGQPVPTENTQSIYEYVSEEGQKVWTTLSRENLNNKPHQIITEDRYPPLVLEGVQEFPFRENCQYDDEGFTCQVPKGYYFAMGDNRDHSADSRYWGFVPEKYIVGKAFLVWMNFKDLSRIGTVIK
jgi:signal peptidase I